jgi:drug/metabolite transporter (DMT)-like permease
MSKKWAAFASLILLQVLNGIVYKSSQVSSTYTYSTFAAIAIAEAVKLFLNVVLLRYFRSKRPEYTSITPSSAPPADERSLQLRHGAKIVALAALYCFDNQWTFKALLKADPAQFIIFRSLSTFVVAFLRCAVLRSSLSTNQWTSVVQIACGLVATQYNVCTASSIISMGTCGVLLISVMVSSFNSVWNESQLKSFPMSMQAQNIILYSGGVVFNLGGHFFTAWTKDDAPGFFSGLSPASACVVFLNALNGIAIPAVYKYSDSVIKSLASAVTTVLLALISWALYDSKLNPVSMSGCIAIASSVFAYTLAPASKQETSTRERFVSVAFLCTLVAAAAAFVSL